MLTLSTLYRIEKTEEKLSMNFLSEMNDRKERKKVESFQNKCVSSQNKQYEKRRGRYRSGYTLPSPQLAASSFVGPF